MKQLFLAVLVSACLAVSTACAAERRFEARLDGAQQHTQTGSAATATASLNVDDATHAVTFTLDVRGLHLTDLSDHLVHAGVGPVHLHIYSDSGDVALLLPFPYGPGYVETGDGFRYAIEDYSYDEGAHFLGSPVGFDAFLAALDGGHVYVNVHTDQHNDGEISGTLRAALR